MKKAGPKREILISGVSQGLGKAIAEVFIKKDSHVTGISRSREKSLDWLACYKKELSYYPCDLKNPTQLQTLLKTLDKNKSNPDLIILNAGYAVEDVCDGINAGLVEEQFAVNLFSGLRIIEQYLPGMLKRGKGTIAVISSLAVFRENHAGRMGYSASKQALARILDNFRLQYEGRGVHFVTIFPGRMGKKNAYGMGISYESAAERICRALLSDPPPKTLSYPFLQTILTKLLHHCPSGIFRRFFYR